MIIMAGYTGKLVGRFSFKANLVAGLLSLVASACCSALFQQTVLF